MGNTGYPLTEEKVVTKYLPPWNLDPEKPTLIWKELCKSQIVEQKLPNDSVPQPPNTTRFVVTSDTHTFHDFLGSVPTGDVLIHCGDFTFKGLPKEVESFANWIEGQSHTTKIVVAGNHDLTFDQESYDILSQRFRHPQKYDCEAIKGYLQKRCIYLEDEEVNVNGFRIYGSPWQPEFCGWAFNLPRGQQIASKWKEIPSNIDILITHGPPLGHGDLCTNEARAGCLDLLWQIQTRVKPKYHLFGHIHEGYGMTTDRQTIFVNASACNSHYNKNKLNPPIVFDLPNPPGYNRYIASPEQILSNSNLTNEPTLAHGLESSMADSNLVLFDYQEKSSDIPLRLTVESKQKKEYKSSIRPPVRQDGSNIGQVEIPTKLLLEGSHRGIITNAFSHEPGEPCGPTVEGTSSSETFSDLFFYYVGCVMQLFCLVHNPFQHTDSCKGLTVKLEREFE